MARRERQIRGRRKLIQLLSDLNPAHLLNAIQQLPPLGSRVRFRSGDADIDEYFSYIGSMSLDELPEDERALIVKAITALSFAVMIELDAKSVSSDYETKIYNMSNNEFIPSPEVWYIPGGYYYARDNYAKISERKRAAAARQRLYRIETYSAERVLNASVSYRFWLLLHLWEEVVLNRTEVRIINLDELPAEVYSELKGLDFHLLSDGGGDGRLFKHTDEFMRFEGLGGIAEKAVIRRYIDLMHDDSILRSSRLLDLNELRALCLDWRDKELLECLERWEAIRLKVGDEKAVRHIISDLKGRDAAGDGHAYEAALPGGAARALGSHAAQSSSAVADSSGERRQVFISYSHKDSKWLERIVTYLKPLERKGVLELWSDRRITPGSDWREEIRSAIGRAKVAVLLVSADFLASDFIDADELPAILRAAETEGLVVLPVVIGPCRYFETQSLSKYQAVNSPSKPLVKLTAAGREEVFLHLSNTIIGILDGHPA